MKKPSISVRLPRPIRGVTITTRGISIRAGEQKLTLVLQGVDHVDEFMGRFAEAWARWEKADDDDDDS